MAYLRAVQYVARKFSTATKPLPGAGITLVQTEGDAKRVLDQLMSLPKHYHACDTEVANIDVTSQSPVGNGNVICATVYSGPEVDFGSGPRLWIDNLDASQVRNGRRQPAAILLHFAHTPQGILNVFKPFFESQEHKKVGVGDSVAVNLLQHRMICTGVAQLRL